MADIAFNFDLIMDSVERFEIGESSNNRFDFLTRRGLKRVLTLLIVLSFLNLIYAFFEKISDKQFQRLFMDLKSQSIINE